LCRVNPLLIGDNRVRTDPGQHVQQAREPLTGIDLGHDLAVTDLECATNPVLRPGGILDVRIRVPIRTQLCPGLGQHRRALRIRDPQAVPGDTGLIVSVALEVGAGHQMPCCLLSVADPLSGR